MAKAQSKLQAFTNLHAAKWNYSSAFQAFVCPAESMYRLIKTNLLVPEDTAITQIKSWVDPSRDNRVIGVTRKNVDRRTDRQTDGFSALYSRLLELQIWHKSKQEKVVQVYAVLPRKRKEEIQDWMSGSTGLIPFKFDMYRCKLMRL